MPYRLGGEKAGRGLALPIATRPSIRTPRHACGMAQWYAAGYVLLKSEGMSSTQLSSFFFAHVRCAPGDRKALRILGRDYRRWYREHGGSRCHGSN